ncbi:lipopolysaccharide-induced tumor necrosis factor-alpha factor homolog [Dunckerocampus dactyliophorus]|uniref:lipopolysaccharide-induced tumor necrosis factor-alpha factor homolog n=1 Tax=Dunckerocampus dactyliophorus TaxID=161453 RepID=UPI002406E05B|nr:lipopolysaccharide-induced tumor necrosis factor-alpha factor homolog [Dunckerocampus dactyliophorus]
MYISLPCQWFSNLLPDSLITVKRSLHTLKLTMANVHILVEKAGPAPIPMPPSYTGPPQTVVVQQSPPVLQTAQIHTVQMPVYQHSAPQLQVVQPAVVAPRRPLKDLPGQMTCPNCHTTGITLVQYKNGTLTWILIAVLLVLFWPLCLIPLCIKSCKDVKHSCATCGVPLYVYKRI